MAGGRLTPHKNWFEGGRALELSGNLMWPISLIPRVRSPHFMVPHTPNVVAPPHDAVPLSTSVTLAPSRSRRCATFSGVGQGTVLPGLRCWARHCAAWPLVVCSAVLCWACVCVVEWFWWDELEWAGWNRVAGVGWSATSWCLQTEGQKHRASECSTQIDELVWSRSCRDIEYICLLTLLHSQLEDTNKIKH